MHYLMKDGVDKPIRFWCKSCLEHPITNPDILSGYICWNPSKHLHLPKLSVCREDFLLLSFPRLSRK